MNDASKNATEELLIDFLEDEVTEQDKKAIRNELRGSVKLRRSLEVLAAVRFEIANAGAAPAETFQSHLHKKIMNQISKTEATSSISRNV